tara:strand:+ start:739 stop:963 length:225 start_codon:yes stop_codon:yes gene_type:complete
MPRLLKYTTQGIVDNVPDQALAVIEHATLFYLVDQNFKGMNKFVAFAVAGAGYEVFIDNLKQGSSPAGFSADKK